MTGSREKVPGNRVSNWVLAAGTFCGLWAAMIVIAQGQSKPKSVLDGVFTAAQAERGKSTYQRECASCHSDTLEGGDEAPAIAGEGFLSQWVGLSVGDLFERTRISMPQDRPGALSRASYADVIAYMFKMSGFPDGKTELVTVTPELKMIQIESNLKK